jgi:beta-glucosidase
VENHLYKNSNVAIDLRVEDLLSRMTIDEKIAQMHGIWADKYERLVDNEGNFDPQKASENYSSGVGHIARPSENARNNAIPGKNARESVKFSNEIQRFFIEKTRLGIPVIFHEECLHGMMARETTSYPVPVAMASTWDTALVERVYTLIAEETRTRAGHQVFAPVLDVARDPRWGRFEETFGEDPYLVGKIGVAVVKGLQGSAKYNEYIDNHHVGVTLKHFAGHGHPEGGSNTAPAHYGERELRDVVLVPFKMCFDETSPVGVMPSYNEVDGVPSHANQWLLDKVLRKEWGFKGVTTADYCAVEQLYEIHKVASDYPEAACIALRAGVDIELPDPTCYRSIRALLEKGKITIDMVNQAVRRLLYCKFRIGLFDFPYLDDVTLDIKNKSDERKQAALESAQKSIILLKNEKNILPVERKKYSTVGVIGPNADKKLLGGYCDNTCDSVTLLQGIKERVGNEITVLYSEGCRITEEGSWFQNEVRLPDPDEEFRRLDDAVSVAEKCDLIVLALGENEQICREAWSKNHLGDAGSLDLIGNQNELLRRIAALGKPVIAVMFHGRALSFNKVAETADAILDCWYLGQESGRAVAGALFGDFSPGGKLTVSVPRSAGHLPAFYNYKPSARRPYLFDDVTPLFPFGYGLSFTQFEFGKPELSQSVMRSDDVVRCTISVRNIGLMAGDEVVQLYIRDSISSVTRPVKELKGFERVSLSPGASVTVSFNISFKELAFYNAAMEYTVEPGEFEIMVGNSSRDEDLQNVVLTVI